MIPNQLNDENLEMHWAELGHADEIVIKKTGGQIELINSSRTYYQNKFISEDLWDIVKQLL